VPFVSDFPEADRHNLMLIALIRMRDLPFSAENVMSPVLQAYHPEQFPVQKVPEGTYFSREYSSCNLLGRDGVQERKK